MSVQSVGRNTNGVGFSMHQVVVEQIVAEKGLAICKEITTSRRMEASLLPVRVRAPKVGEIWFIDQDYGFWSFSSLVVANAPPATPQVTGAKASADPITLSLLAAMVQIGLVTDGTT